MRTMKIIIACLICTMIMGFLLPVGKVEAASNEVKKDASLGGWELVTDNTPSMMKEEDSARINTALKDIGGSFDVLDLVATQVVSGTNYMYLVYGREANSTDYGYYFVTVYEDVKGNDSIIGLTSIDINNIQAATPLGDGATGAWAVRKSGKAGMLPDENAQASFDAINNGEVIYNPVALLATQIVSGTNYKALCIGNDKNLYVVTWYRNLQGNASLTFTECVNIGEYLNL